MATIYQSYISVREKVLDERLNGPGRFQSISEREDRSDMPVEAVKAQCKGRYLTEHRGCQVMKSADDMVIYQQLLWRLRPATIIELGAFTGGSAIWMADMMRLMEIGTTIYSMDIDLSTIENQVKKLQPNNVTFREGDSNKIEKSFPDDFLKALPHPWLVIDDAHVNIYGLMKHFHQFMTTGDYFVIEDLRPELPVDPGYGVVITELVPVGEELRLNHMKRFMTDHSKDYAVDSFYTDFYGYNGTWNMNGYIRRM